MFLLASGGPRRTLADRSCRAPAFRPLTWRAHQPPPTAGRNRRRRLGSTRVSTRVRSSLNQDLLACVSVGVSRLGALPLADTALTRNEGVRGSSPASASSSQELGPPSESRPPGSSPGPHRYGTAPSELAVGAPPACPNHAERPTSPAAIEVRRRLPARDAVGAHHLVVLVFEDVAVPDEAARKIELGLDARDLARVRDHRIFDPQLPCLGRASSATGHAPTRGSPPRT